MNDEQSDLNGMNLPPFSNQAETSESALVKKEAKVLYLDPRPVRHVDRISDLWSLLFKRPS